MVWVNMTSLKPRLNCVDACRDQMIAQELAAGIHTVRKEGGRDVLWRVETRVSPVSRHAVIFVS